MKIRLSLSSILPKAFWFSTKNAVSIKELSLLISSEFEINNCHLEFQDCELLPSSCIQDFLSEGDLIV